VARITGDMRSSLVLAVLGLLAAAVFLFGPDLPELRLLTKPLPVLCLVAGVGARDPLARCLQGGLLVSALGDGLLEAGFFLPGLLAFLAAHVSYAAGFCLDTRRPALLRALPFAVWGSLIYLHLRPGLGGLAIPVLVYVLAICTMMWRAAARIGAHGPPRRDEWAGLLGAMAFAASDTLIAFDRFRTPLPHAQLPIMVLYWAGQCGIAWAAWGRGHLGYAPPGRVP
jgi:uncharacterized membrane protein YhhN